MKEFGALLIFLLMAAAVARADETARTGEQLMLPPAATNPSSPCPDGKKGPSPWLLLGVGVGIAPLAYELGVIWHEGSHAVWATAFGAHVTGYYPYPRVVPGTGFVFGYTSYTGQMTDAQTALTAIAPKFTDLAILGAYTITNETGNLPENKWAQLAIDAIGVAAVVDLGHDVFQTNPYGDIPEFYRNAHITSSAGQAGMRVLQGGLTLAGAVEVGHGIYKLFAPEPSAKPLKPVEFKPHDFSVVPYVGSEALGLTGTF